MSHPTAVARGLPVTHTHRNISGGPLRPVIFGAMDGLISNLSLVTGVAGASVSRHVLLLTGLAGLIAGAFSMGLGEYTSVTSQREALQAEIEIERRELARNPEAEEAELTALYESRGLRHELALEVARAFSADPEQVWRIHAREELGVDPDALPSGLLAALSSFASFALGACLPLIPYAAGARGLLPSVILAGVALFTIGCVVSRFTGRFWLVSGLRQLLLGACAAAVTFGVGHAVGTGVH